MLGVPQGSCLGPIFYTLQYCDLQKVSFYDNVTIIV